MATWQVHRDHRTRKAARRCRPSLSLPARVERLGCNFPDSPVRLRDVADLRLTLPYPRLLGRGDEPGDSTGVTQWHDAIVGQFGGHSGAVEQPLGGRYIADDLQMVEGIGDEI